MKFTRIHLSIFLGLGVLIWFVTLQVQGIEVTLDHLTPFGTVLSTLVISLLILEHYLWRIKLLHPWFVNRPDIKGTWRVEIKPNRLSEEDTQDITIFGYMGVKQTLSKLQMHLMTDDSESWLIAESINKSPSDEGFQIVGVYSNTPSIHLRGKQSDIHYGALILYTHGSSHIPISMTGEYWTDRKTSGSLFLSNKVDSVFTRFEDAESVFKT